MSELSKLWAEATLRIMAQPDDTSRAAMIKRVAKKDPALAESLQWFVGEFKKRMAAGELTPEELDRIASDKRRRM